MVKIVDVSDMITQFCRPMFMGMMNLFIKGLANW